MAMRDDHQRKEGGLRTRGVFRKSTPESPLVSVITVVYNGDRHLEQTILSVMNQGYGNIEYIILDGGSSDGTLDIIGKYEDRIDYWASEPDKGTYDAMNRGIGLASGELIGLLNSDDYYEPGAIETIAETYRLDPAPRILYGNAYAVQEEMQVRYKTYPHTRHWFGMGIYHPAMFVHKDVYGAIGTYDTAYRASADFDFMLRAIRNRIVFTRVDEFLANYRTSGFSAVNLRTTLGENRDLIRIYFGLPSREYLLSSIVYHKSSVLIAVQRVIGAFFGEDVLKRARIWYLKKFFVKEAEVLK